MRVKWEKAMKRKSHNQSCLTALCISLQSEAWQKPCCFHHTHILIPQSRGSQAPNPVVLECQELLSQQTRGWYHLTPPLLPSPLMDRKHRFVSIQMAARKTEIFWPLLSPPPFSPLIQTLYSLQSHISTPHSRYTFPLFTKKLPNAVSQFK